MRLIAATAARGFWSMRSLSKTESITLDQAEALVKRFEVGDFNELLRVALYGTPPRPPKVAAADEAA